MKLHTFFKLGRVSNLPTVWTNVSCGFVLGRAMEGSNAGLGLSDAASLSALGVAGTLLYIGGMFLNDAFDANVDAKERPERPIPSGEITRTAVFSWGFGMLAVGLIFTALFPLLHLAPNVGVAGAAAVTALFIVAYDKWHKGNAWAPLMMGACRAGLYGMGALVAVGSVRGEVWGAALALALYVLGLTHVARFENGTVLRRVWILFSIFAPSLLALLLPWVGPWVWAFLLLHLAWAVHALSFGVTSRRRDIKRSVVSLIAGISLVDALFVSITGDLGAGLACVGGFALTLLLQRWVSGT